MKNLITFLFASLLLLFSSPEVNAQDRKRVRDFDLETNLTDTQVLLLDATTYGSGSFKKITLSGLKNFFTPALSTGYLPYKGTSSLVDSPIFTNGKYVGINNTSPTTALDLKPDIIPITCPNPTGDITIVPTYYAGFAGPSVNQPIFNYGEQSDYWNGGYGFGIYVYALKTINGIPTWSAPGKSNNGEPVYDNGLDDNSYTITWSWSAVPDAELYRVFLYDEWYGCSYNVYVDLLPEQLSLTHDPWYFETNGSWDDPPISPTGFVNTGQSYTVRMYNYILLNGLQIYSANYLEKTFSDNNLNDALYDLTLSWSPQSNVAGYRVLINSTHYSANYDFYTDFADTSYIDNSTLQWNEGSTVTPTVFDFTNLALLVQGKAAIQDSLVLNGTLNVTGNSSFLSPAQFNSMSFSGSFSALGTSNFSGISTFNSLATFNSGTNSTNYYVKNGLNNGTQGIGYLTSNSMRLGKLDASNLYIDVLTNQLKIASNDAFTIPALWIESGSIYVGSFGQYGMSPINSGFILAQNGMGIGLPPTNSLFNISKSIDPINGAAMGFSLSPTYNSTISKPSTNIKSIAINSNLSSPNLEQTISSFYSLYIGSFANANITNAYGIYLGNYYQSSGTTTNKAALYIVQSAGYSGFGMDSNSNEFPQYDISLGSKANATIGINRLASSYGTNAGQNLSITSGGALSGAYSAMGGHLYLKSGISTGTGQSYIYFQTPSPGAMGTTDNIPTTKMILTGNGNVGITTTAPGGQLSLGNTTAGTTTANQAMLYTLSGELYVKDANGNQTIISPHATDAPNWLYDNTLMPDQVLKETNDFEGIVRYTNNTRRDKLFEMQLNGENLPNGNKRKFIFTETYAEHNQRTGANLIKETWDNYQDRELQNSLNAIEIWENEKAFYEKRKSDAFEAKEDFTEKFEKEKPTKYIKQNRKKI